MELEKVHLLRILQMPGGTSEILLRGEKNGTTSFIHKSDSGRIVITGKSGIDGRREAATHGHGVGSGPKPEKAAGITADSFG